VSGFNVSPGPSQYGDVPKLDVVGCFGCVVVIAIACLVVYGLVLVLG
jgi:hypothetical protein